MKEVEDRHFGIVSFPSLHPLVPVRSKVQPLCPCSHDVQAKQKPKINGTSNYGLKPQKCELKEIMSYTRFPISHNSEKSVVTSDTALHKPNKNPCICVGYALNTFLASTAVAVFPCLNPQTEASKIMLENGNA